MSDKKHDQIDRYLGGDMSPAELEDFQQALRSDEDMRDVLMLETALREHHHRTEKDRFASWTQAATKPKSKLPKMAILIGGAIVLLLLAWLFFFRQPHPIDKAEGLERLELAIAQDSVALQVVADDTQQGWRGLLLAGSPQNTSPWRQAKQRLEELIAQSTTACNAKLGATYYYAGILAVYLDRNYAQASSYLSCAYEHEPRYRAAIALPLALSHLGQGDIEAARKLLMQHQVFDDELPQKAREMLRYKSE